MDPFIITKLPSLSLTISSAPKSIVSDISTATPAFISLLMFSGISFPSFYFYYICVFILNCISYRSHIVGSYFIIQYGNLCFLNGDIYTAYIYDMVKFKSIIFLFFFLFVPSIPCSFFFSSTAFIGSILEYFLNIYFGFPFILLVDLLAVTLLCCFVIVV